ncbi:MAG: dTMP kinase [Nannocystaceae bacterium]
MDRGVFIVLEGIDGSGTSTQSGALAATLRARGHEVVETCEPSERSIGRLTRARLARDAEPLDRRALALLFAADRLDHVAREIEPALAAGQVVLSDRYLMSSWVYQSLDCDPQWVREINRFAPWPDLTFVLDVSAAEAMRRVAGREGIEEIFETTPQQVRLAQAYAEHARDASLPRVHRLDGSRPQSEVTAMLLEACVAAGL